MMKGQIINKPGGKNVYLNVPKDYTENVSKKNNFLDFQADESFIEIEECNCRKFFEYSTRHRKKWVK